MKIKRHDTQPGLKITLYDGRTVINLTGATVKVIGQRELVNSTARTGPPLFSRATTGSAAGVVLMDWQAGDTSRVGSILIEVEVTWPNGAIQTFPSDGYLRVEVVADLG